MSAQGPVVLVGLPGAGKSKVGRLLAERLGVDHIDTDALVVEREGRPIADIFATDGEAAFRVMETKAVAEALTHEAVVSLGGGAAAPRLQPTLKLRQTPRPARRKRAALCIVPQRMSAFAVPAAGSMPIRFRFLQRLSGICMP